MVYVLVTVPSDDKERGETHRSSRHVIAKILPRSDNEEQNQE